MHKRTLGLIVFSVILMGGAISIVARGGDDGDLQPMTVRGQIWDSTCAAAGSHGKMMAKMNAKDVKECTLNCVKAGAQLVLYNSDDKTTYRLDPQDKAMEYAGQTVTVIGNYDRATSTLHVDRIETGM
jgi:hypothetical protein